MSNFILCFTLSYIIDYRTEISLECCDEQYHPV